MIIHPYQDPNFWLNPANQFWRKGIYSTKSKEYFDNVVAEMVEKALLKQEIRNETRSIQPSLTGEMFKLIHHIL